VKGAEAVSLQTLGVVDAFDISGVVDLFDMSGVRVVKVFDISRLVDSLTSLWAYASDI
jgi:hypothetical protein